MTLEDDDPALEPERKPAPDPWERMPGEPSEAWELFSRYVLSEAPSIAKFAAEVGTHSRSALAAMSARWRWLARRDALTWHLHREAVQGAAEEARAQGAAHARVTASLLDWAAESIARRRAAGELLDAREATAAVKAMVDLQRVAAGEPTARTAIDLSRASDADLDALEKALARISAGGSQESSHAPPEPIEKIDT